MDGCRHRGDDRRAFSYHLTVSVPGLIVVRIFQGAGFVCLIAAMMALIVCYIPPQKSGQAFGFVSTVRLVPYAIVPPLVSSLAETPQDFRLVLQYMIVLMLLSIAMLFFSKTKRHFGRRSLTGTCGLGRRSYSRT